MTNIIEKFIKSKDIPVHFVLNDPYVDIIFEQFGLRKSFYIIKQIYLWRDRPGLCGICIHGNLAGDFLNTIHVDRVVDVFIYEKQHNITYVFSECRLGTISSDYYTDKIHTLSLHTYEQIQTIDEYNMSKALM